MKFNFKKKSLTVIALSWGCLTIFSQSNPEKSSSRFKSLEFRTHTGMHLYSGKTLTSQLDAGYGSFELRMSWQGRGEDHWSGQFGYPSYGVGVYSGFIGDPQIFGNPNAVFGFINFPISKATRRNVFAIEPALGLTYNLKSFSKEENPLNDAIGARMAVYFNVNFGFAYKWTRQMDITYGIDFTHFSNGRTYAPNYGLNMFGINLGLRYNYNTANHYKNMDFEGVDEFPSRYDRQSRFKNLGVDQHNSLNAFLALSTVQTDEGAGTDTRYMALSAVLDYQYKFNQVHGITGGFDYFFDGSLEERYPDDLSRRHLVGIHAGYDFMFWRMTMLMHIGTYLTDSQGKKPLYARIGLRYDISNRIYTQVALKTESTVADWVEFGIGIRAFKW